MISRRARHHAGARYIKRGINELVILYIKNTYKVVYNNKGFVANFVETEQILVDKSIGLNIRPICSSFM